VLDWVDPFSSQRDSSSWSYTAARANMPPMPQGKYYVSVRAYNNVVRGGPLLTTVCNTVPLVVEYVPPILNTFLIEYSDISSELQFSYNAT
jgi:hypothetical protein